MVLALLVGFLVLIRTGGADDLWKRLPALLFPGIDPSASN
jgi:hypothetical protein